jgi:hypothetical protein
MLAQHANLQVFFNIRWNYIHLRLIRFLYQPDILKICEN